MAVLLAVKMSSTRFRIERDAPIPSSSVFNIWPAWDTFRGERILLDRYVMNSFFAQSTDSLISDNFLTGQDGHDQAAHNQYDIVGYEKAFPRIKKIEHNIITCYENSKQKTEEGKQ